MKELNKIEIPASPQQDQTPSTSVWKDGKLMIQRGVNQDTYFIGHETRTVNEVREGPDGPTEPISREGVFAFPIPVKKPASYGDVVDAAERAAYNLFNDVQAISFTASLSRKYREDNQDAEVIEHDEFISFVKAELAPIFK